MSDGQALPPTAAAGAEGTEGTYDQGYGGYGGYDYGDGNGAAGGGYDQQAGDGQQYDANNQGQYDGQGGYTGYDNYNAQGDDGQGGTYDYGQGYGDGGGNPINQLNEQGADQNYDQGQQGEAQPLQQQQQQQPLQLDTQSTSSKQAVQQQQQQQQQGDAQEMTTIPVQQQYANQQQQQPMQQQMQQQLQQMQQQQQLQPMQQQQQMQFQLPAGMDQMTTAQQQQLIMNSSAPGDIRMQLQQLMGKSPGTALKEHEPESDGWLADVCIAFGTSLGFKLYMIYLLWSSLVLFTFIGYDYIWATLYRMMHPPDSDASLFGQSVAYLCIFFVLSFFVVSVLCTNIDMMRDYWTMTTTEPRLWGFKLFDKKAPWPLYALLSVTNLLAPILWSFIATLADGRKSIFYFFQHLAYTSQTMIMFVVLIIFVWFWFRAAREKGRALGRRHESPDEKVGVRQNNLLEAGGKPDVLGNLSGEVDLEKVETWWKSEIVMTEWGMDQKTVLWTILAFGACFAPLLIILVFLATEGDSDGWNAAWLVLAVIFFCLLILLHQTAVSRQKKGLSAVCSFLGLGCFILFGVIGGGAAGSGALFGVFFILLLLVQMMMTRKRQFSMTRREIYHHFKQPFDEDYEEKRGKKMFDSYCCCCKPLAFACCSCCFDINKVFGYEYPEVNALVEKERKKRMALRTDQNLLAIYWWVLCIAVLILLIFSRLTGVWYGDHVLAATSNAAGTDAVTNMLPVCQVTHGGPMTMYEMSLLAVLSLSGGSSHQADYTTWFGGPRSDFIPKYDRLSNTFWRQSVAAWALWTSYVPSNNTADSYTYIVVRGADKGPNYMRHMDYWGDSMSLQVASVLAPHLMIWPQEEKASFVLGVSFLKKIYGGHNMTDGLEAYVKSLPGKKILIGHGFAGGDAMIAAARTGSKAVTFNAPGIGYMYRKFGFANPMTDAKLSQDLVSVSAAKNLYGLIDQTKDVGMQQQVPCAADTHQDCTSMQDLVVNLKEYCGDAYGRTLTPKP